MSQLRKSPVYEPPRQSEIHLQVTVELGTIKEDPSGKNPMVVAAFEMAGSHINEQAAQGKEANVEFDYMGAHFSAFTDGGRNLLPTGEDFDD